MESHFMCLFRYGLGLCIKKFTKNALTLTAQKSPLEFSLSLSHTLVSHRGLIGIFRRSSPSLFYGSPPGFCMFHLPFVSSQSSRWVMFTVARENPRRPVLKESPNTKFLEKGLANYKLTKRLFFFFRNVFLHSGQ